MERAEWRADIPDSLLPLACASRRYRTWAQRKVGNDAAHRHRLVQVWTRKGASSDKGRDGRHQSALPHSYARASLELECFTSGRGVPLARAAQKHIVRYLDKPRVEEVIARIVQLDGAHLVFEVIASGAVQVDIVELEPAFPEPLCKPRHALRGGPNSLHQHIIKEG